jgi:iron complex outermembrane receptor protein
LTSITGYTYVNPIGAVDVDASVVTPANAPTCFAYFSCQSVSLTNPDRSESQEFDFASPDIGIFSFVSGLYAYHDSAFETVNANDAYLLHSQVVTSAYAAFGEATAHVTEQLAAVAGVRYSWEHKVLYGAYAFDVPLPEANEGTWHSWTPRFSLMYRLTDSINTYATYSQGFKSGVLDATSFSTPALQPEKLDAYEVGIKLATTSAALNVSAFYYDYKDIQVKVFASGESTLLQNAAAAKIYGLDADGTLQINDQLQIRGGASYVPHADYTDYPGAIGFVPPLTQFGLQQVNLNASGDRMIRTPKLTANLAATYTTDFTIGRLALTGNLYHSSSYSWEITNRVNTDEYSVLNARLSFTPRDSIWTVSLFGNNLANKAYVDGALPSGSSNLVFYAPPREAGVSVDAKF